MKKRSRTERGLNFGMRASHFSGGVGRDRFSLDSSGSWCSHPHASPRAAIARRRVTPDNPALDDYRTIYNISYRVYRAVFFFFLALASSGGAFFLTDANKRRSEDCFQRTADFYGKV